MSQKEEYPEPVTGALILNRKGEVFLMQSPKWEDRWIVPGGHVEKGEKLEDSLKREVREETGLEVTDIELLDVLEGIPDDFEREVHFIFINFTCRAVSEEVELDNREGTDYTWIDPEDALEELELNESTEKFIREYLERENE